MKIPGKQPTKKRGNKGRAGEKQNQRHASRNVESGKGMKSPGLLDSSFSGAEATRKALDGRWYLRGWIDRNPPAKS